MLEAVGELVVAADEFDVVADAFEFGCDEFGFAEAVGDGRDAGTCELVALGPGEELG